MRSWPPSTDRGVDAVIDTDTTNEIDDQFAVVWALLRPDRFRSLTFTACPYEFGPSLLERPGVVPPAIARRVAALGDGPHRDASATVAPAEGVARAEAELHTILDLMGHAAPDRVHRGAEGFLPGPDQPVDSPAARHIVERAHAATADDPLWVLAIGCATNVASALLLDPSIRDRVAVVWTAAHPTYWPDPDASFNLGLDLHATRALFAANAPTLYVPGYHVGEDLRVSDADVAAHVADRGAAGRYLARLHAEHPLVAHGPGRTWVLWDLACVAAVIDPAWVTTRSSPRPTLDADLRWQHADGPPVVEAVDLDRDAILGDLFRVLGDRR